jgi:hypothetical protein
MLDRRILRNRFGPDRQEVTRGLRKLLNEELYDIHFSQNITRVIKFR